MKIKVTKLVTAVILSLCLLTPLISISAKRNQDPIIIYTVPDFDNFILYDYSEEMPNGFIKVDVGYRFFWYDEDFNLLGYAEQYIVGVKRVGKGNDFETLRGCGVFTSTIDDKPGTITYTIGNNWVTDTNIMWAGRLHIVGGTETFEGIKGPGKLNFELFAFELYVNFNPWE
ncbi:MAG: hypothetical protein ABIJ47_07005 [Candidatus Bathyarchaeota archaeon]